MYMYLGYSLKSHHVSRPINSDKAKESTAVSNQKFSIIITVSVTVQCNSKAQQVINHARPSLCNLLLSCFSSFSYPFFRNRIAISSYSSCARCQANASSQHKRGKVDSNAPLTARAVHLVWRLQVVVVVVQSSFVVEKGLVVMSDVRSRHE